MAKKEKKPKLPAVFKRKWLKALRSGEYVQCYSRLRDKGIDKDDNTINTYCCLGVACEVVGYRPPLGKGFISKKSKRPSQADKVPDILRGSDGIAHNLSDFNDNHGWSFKKIAAWVDKNL
jgi:hypothetical protein